MTLITKSDKICASCGRPMEWRKAWEKNWESIRYCSDSCRRDKFDKTSGSVRDAILAMVKVNGLKKPVAEAEVAQYLWQADWEKRLEEVRRVARQLHHAGLITIFQSGRPIKDLNFKGAVHFVPKI
jgi:hypothetical protein